MDLEPYKFWRWYRQDWVSNWVFLKTFGIVVGLMAVYEYTTIALGALLELSVPWAGRLAVLPFALALGVYLYFKPEQLRKFPGTVKEVARGWLWRLPSRGQVGSRLKTWGFWYLVIVALSLGLWYIPQWIGDLLALLL